MKVKKNKNRVIFFNIYINGDFDLDLLIVDLKVQFGNMYQEIFILIIIFDVNIYLIYFYKFLRYGNMYLNYYMYCLFFLVFNFFIESVLYFFTNWF